MAMASSSSSASASSSAMASFNGDQLSASAATVLAITKFKRSGSMPKPASSAAASASAASVAAERRPSLNSSVLKSGIQCLANSQSDISFAKREMEHLIQRERRAIEEYEKPPGAGTGVGVGQAVAESAAAAAAPFVGSGPGVGRGRGGSRSATSSPSAVRNVNFVTNVRKWIHLQLETGKTQRKAREDVKRAVRAMSAAEDMLCQMEEAMEQEEEDLQMRARQLRRMSVGTFKVMADVRKVSETSQQLERGCYENAVDTEDEDVFLFEEDEDDDDDEDVENDVENERKDKKEDNCKVNTKEETKDEDDDESKNEDNDEDKERAVTLVKDKDEVELELVQGSGGLTRKESHVNVANHDTPL